MLNHKQGKYWIPHKHIKMPKPVYDDLLRLKGAHGNLSFHELINHLILEHDIAQDKRLERGKGNNMAKSMLGKGSTPSSIKVLTSRGWFSVPANEWTQIQRERGPVNPDVEVERLCSDDWLKRGLALGIVRKRGRPKGSKDIDPRNRKQKRMKMALGV